MRKIAVPSSALALESEQPLTPAMVSAVWEIAAALDEQRVPVQVPNSVWLGSRLIEYHSQNKTVAASMIAEKNVSGHRSYRVATRRQSLRRPNMISIRLRRL